ncbi:hypothetical protein SVA_1368 [Sulfurifustis variabilis]|uniref:NnrS family protein n=1 Tax=Sulfurifustis variabilis TaxID=1675686 RepID=A0A1B4V302_9GAMM|nr:hypothetical protein [Sulfurifustis variabilis]BAU47933.1 hypothetical protein SVA_1368 [Sulfurifustis variabilis]
MKAPIRHRWLQGPVPPPYRIPLLVLGFMALVIGVGAGLRRLGVDAPLPSPGLIALHGPLMVSGFFGTLISLERAVALGARWTYGGPVFAALGAATLVGGTPVWTGALLLALGSAFLVAGSLAVFLRQRAVFTATLLAGAASWLIGNLAWLAGLPFTAVVPWWAGFLVLTIAGERLELSRFLAPPAAAQRAFVGIVAMLLGGLALLAAGIDPRGFVASGALLALTLWLARYDIARRTVRETGLTRFIAVALLSGYVWLGAAAAIALAGGGLFVAPAYDATLHAVFLGFVFSMVFGHAPIILPAVTHFAVRFHRAFYLHLALLHVSLIVRLGADLAGSADWRAIGGALNAVALLAFILNTASGIWRGRLKISTPASAPNHGARA